MKTAIFLRFHRKEVLQLIEEFSVHEHVSADYLRRARLASICAYASLPLLGEYKEVSSEATNPTPKVPVVYPREIGK